MVRSAKVMEIIEEDQLCNNAALVGEYLQNRLHEIAAKKSIMSNVRGRGLLTSFDFPDKATRDEFIARGMEKNVMFLGCGAKTIRFRPALIIEKNHIDEGLSVLETLIGNL
jgi:L-lysine 6-transaminase